MTDRTCVVPAGAARALVLASASATRAQLLARAGVAFESVSPAVDEGAVRTSLIAEGADARAIAETLADLKARRISERRPECLVIGADQVLDCEGRFYEKPRDREQARAQLRSLCGRRHRLTSSVCVVRAATSLWHHTDSAELEMRSFSDQFLDWYLDQVGEAACDSVGAYQLESLGAQLFHRVEGDPFTILGLPLLPLLDFLREHGIVTP